MDTPEIAAAKIRTLEEIGTIHMLGDFVRAPSLACVVKVKVKVEVLKVLGVFMLFCLKSMVQVHGEVYWVGIGDWTEPE